MRTITSDLFSAFSKCPIKCYRMSKGEKGDGNAFADWLVDQENSYREEGFNWLAEKSKTRPFEMGHLEKSALKDGQWQFALNCRIIDLYLESYLDAVERIAMGICETCRFKGVNFLNFLRSGEKNIEQFVSRTRKNFSLANN